MKMKNNLSFIDRFENFILANKLIQKNDKLLVGFSGGADSTALLCALWHLKTKYHLSFLVAHINYNLRDEDSLRDEEFVKDFCFKRNISLVVKNVQIKKNSENHTRKIRFKYFNDLRKLYKINKIVLGHNKKDQAETMIFRLFRGAGYTGIKGIAPKVGNVIHPLLPFSRNEIEEYLQSQNINWCEDISNQNNEFSRNRIRNELLPWVQKNLNGNVVEKLFQASQIFTETDEILETLAMRRLQKIQKHKNHLAVEIHKLKKVRKVIRFYIYKHLFAKIVGDANGFYHSHFEEIEAILVANGSKKLKISKNVFVFKQYDELLFSDKDISQNQILEEEKIIERIRRRTVFEDYRVTMKKLKIIPHKRNIEEYKNVIYLDLDKIIFPIYLKHRQAGDSFFPRGMEHAKKLKKFFIDEKIPKFERSKILIFWDSEKIIWVGGFRADNRVVATTETKNILMLEIEKISRKKMRAAERFK